MENTEQGNTTSTSRIGHLNARLVHPLPLRPIPSYPNSIEIQRRSNLWRRYYDEENTTPSVGQVAHPSDETVTNSEASDLRATSDDNSKASSSSFGDLPKAAQPLPSIISSQSIKPTEENYTAHTKTLTDVEAAVILIDSRRKLHSTITRGSDHHDENPEERSNIITLSDYHSTRFPTSHLRTTGHEDDALDELSTPSLGDLLGTKQLLPSYQSSQTLRPVAKTLNAHSKSEVEAATTLLSLVILCQIGRTTAIALNRPKLETRPEHNRRGRPVLTSSSLSNGGKTSTSTKSKRNPQGMKRKWEMDESTSEMTTVHQAYQDRHAPRITYEDSESPAADPYLMYRPETVGQSLGDWFPDLVLAEEATSAAESSRRPPALVSKPRSTPVKFSEARHGPRKASNSKTHEKGLKCAKERGDEVENQPLTEARA